MSFTPLYVISEYSILQSTCHIDRLVDAAYKLGYKAIGIADDGVMHGAYKFYKACLNKNIKPIIGLTVLVNIQNIESKMVIIAENNIGYHNLMYLSSLYQIKKLPLSMDVIIPHMEGLTFITAGKDNIFYSYLQNHDYNSLNNYINLLKNTFKHLYVGLSHEVLGLSEAVNILRDANINACALPKYSMIDSSDLEAKRVLKAIKTGNKDIELSPTEELEYLEKKSQMDFYYDSFPELLKNLDKIINSVNISITTGKTVIPKYEEGLDSEKYLYELAAKGLKKRITTHASADAATYLERFNKEFEIIKSMGFVDYFLIVWDYVKYAKKNNIFVGPGRGSAGASLIAYSLGITDVDPIKYNLLFERFLNPERISMPDIDIDFPDDKRAEVVKYVAGKYGKTRVAAIAAFSTFQANLAVNDVAKVYNINETYIKQIKKVIADNPDKTLLELQKEESLLDLMNAYEEIDKVVKIASRIQNLPKSISTHAAGIIIAPNDLFNYTALDNSTDDVYQTQFEAHDLEELGLLKMDFLALKNLSNIKNTIDLIVKDYPAFTLPYNEDDKEVYRMLSYGDVLGVFQLESPGMKKLILDMKPDRFSDLVSALALFRPGPMDSIPHFIACKKGIETITYPHPALESILKETYGLIVYQEQIMQIARCFAGYSLGKADVLRRAVSKKNHEVLEKERTSFVSSSINNGYDSKTANEIYDIIVKFADYGFNKAHSVAYARLAYITAYLKCRYPAYYLASLMDSFVGANAELDNLRKNAYSKHVSLINPDINYSNANFMPFKQTILCPLTMIKGIGVSLASKLNEIKNNKPFESFKDFIERTKGLLTTEQIESLIYSSALDSFKLTKKAMIENIDYHLKSIDFIDMPGIREASYTNEEYSYGMLCEKEKEAIGINIKYNVFAKYEYLYRQNGLLHITNFKENCHIKTLGIVKQIKIINTKNNEEMCFMTIADDAAEIEVTVFPRLLKECPSLAVGSLVIVQGKTEIRRNLQIIADFIQML